MSDSQDGDSSKSRSDRGEEEPSPPDQGASNESKSPETSRNTSKQPKEENPFSFRQFLAQGDANPPRNTGARPKTRHRMPVPNGEDHSASQDIKAGLPDFLKDYMSPPEFEDSSAQNPAAPASSRVSAEGLGLPFDLTSGNQGHLQDEKRAREVEGEGSGFASLSLPDFLSDGALASADSDSGAGNSNSSLAPEVRSGFRIEVDARHSGAAAEPQAIGADALRLELANCRYLLERERERSQVLEQKLKQIKREEAKDWGSLDDPLKCTELRLAEALSRADHAEKLLSETEAARRQLERRMLRMGQETGKEDPDGAAASSGGGLALPQNLVLMRVRRAAAQISLAAEVAETSLGQLLSGVESLKTVASDLRALIEDHAEDEAGEGGACGFKNSKS